ncbi:MAG: iron-containing alcohol dehydrogenase [Acidimicrobiales bacterium]
MSSHTAVIEFSTLSRRLGARSGGSAVIFVDDRLRHEAIVDIVTEHIAASRVRYDIEPVTAVADVSTVRSMADRVEGRDVVIAIGGGRTIDCAKLATAVGVDRSLSDRLVDLTDVGSLYLTGGLTPETCRIAIPTTLGTGAERSQSAVVDNAHGRLIVGSRQLRPNAALLSPIATRGLSRDLVLSGVFEAICRVVGPAARSPIGAREDLLLAAVHRLVALGYGLAGADRPGSAECDHRRREVAQLSGLAHTRSMHRERGPSAFPAWFIATELSWSCGVEKTRALARIMPAVWRRALHGDASWGSPSAIGLLWSAARMGSPVPLPSDPSAGLAVLTESWGIDSAVPALDAGALSQRIARRWGGDGGYLGELDAPDLASVLRGIAAPITTRYLEDLERSHEGDVETV